MTFLLHNRTLLYAVFLIALIDFLYLVSINDIETASVFALVGILTAFFTKNMIVILVVAIIVANVLKYGKRGSSHMEGLENQETNDKKDMNSDKNKDKKTKGKNTSKPKEDTEDTDENGVGSLSVENTAQDEHFSQSKDAVKTTDADRELDKSDKMILAQEKLLERMNKYKPLLDTLNGLTKNIAMVKGLSTADKE